MNFKTNIKHIGDPFVVKHKGTYYVYATSFAEGFHVWTSTDLKTFSEPKLCYQRTERSFGYKDFWAPEVIFDGKQFVMHYSARDKKSESLRIGVAVSSNPLGPFIDVNDQSPMFDLGYAAIDGHVFIDSNQKKYFYFAKDCSENTINGVKTSEIYVVDLADDFLSIIGTPKRVLTPELPYETIGFNDGDQYMWNEGPFVIKENDIYYLMYSANYYADKNYCICVASSMYPDKEFKKYDEPILTYKEINESGPGHHMLLKDEEQYLCVYHVHTNPNKPSGDRTMCYIPMSVINQKFVFHKY